MFANKKPLKIISLAVASLVIIYFGLITFLIALDEPQFKTQAAQEMTPEQIDDLGFEQRYNNSPATFIMRDDAILTAQYFEKDSDLTIVVLHGILSSSYMNNRFAGLMSLSANAQVYSLDLRGHGASSGLPGDVSYIGQYVDDVADVVASIKKDKPAGKIIVAGHSMGGGIALRYALKQNVPDIDGYLLFAPQLGEDSPTNVLAGKAKEQGQSFMAIHLARIIGLALLNAHGLNQWNDLPVLFFNLPAQMPVTQYTFRSSASMSPTDYKSALRSVDKPLLVLVGENDEAFNAAVYETQITTYSDGELHLIKGQTHNGVRHDSSAMNHVKKWIMANGLSKEIK